MIGTLVIMICITILQGFVLFIVKIVSLHQKSREKFLLDLEQMKNNFRNEILQSELESRNRLLKTYPWRSTMNQPDPPGIKTEPDHDRTGGSRSE